MNFLLLSIASAVLIAVILRVNEDRSGDRFVVAGLNYVVASVLSIIVMQPSAGIGTGAFVFATVVGLGFVGGFVSLMRAISEIGLAVPATAARLSTVIPVVGSIALYDELPSAFQSVGIAIGLAAFIVLGASQRGLGRAEGVSRMGLRLLIAVFLISGFVDFSLKIANEGGASRGSFLAIVFATAFVVCAIATAVRRTRIRVRDVLIGCALGIPNFTASYFLLRALEQLPGVVLFPAMNAAVVLGVTTVAVTVWREIPRRITAIGLALAAFALVLLGLG